MHWPYDPSEVQALLPDGLEVDAFDDGAGPRAWVSLVPFRMRRAGPAFLPPLPWVSTFAETNVRTYVVDSAGNRAVWFLSLDAARLPIVAFARWTIGFPYVWSTMAIDRTGDRWTYETTRRQWPRSPAASTRLVVDAGPTVEPTPLDVFLTARWGTVAEWRGQLRHHPVDHPPWTLRTATIVELDDTARDRGRAHGAVRRAPGPGRRGDRRSFRTTDPGVATTFDGDDRGVDRERT